MTINVILVFCVHVSVSCPSLFVFIHLSLSFRVQVWDIETGQSVHTFVGHTGAVSALAVHPMGQLLFTGSKDATVHLFGERVGVGHVRDTMTSTGVILTHTHSFSCFLVFLFSCFLVFLFSCFLAFSLLLSLSLSFSLSLSLLFTLYSSRLCRSMCALQVRVWDLSSGVAVRTLGAHVAEVTSVQLDDKGKLPS